MTRPGTMPGPATQGMVEDVCYNRLYTSAELINLVGARIYPTTPTENTAPPFAPSTVSSAEPNVHAKA